jgi:glycosyltransferase involved in cell wall biosynthesis
MRILFVNHTSTASGAEQGLMRLVVGLGQTHPVAVACPRAGALPEMIDAASVQRFAVPAFEASFRTHPVHTPVGVARLGAGGLAIARVARRFQAHLLHANSARAGLMCAIARRLGGPPVVVHLRDDLPLTGLGRAVRFCLARSAGAVVAVSRYTAGRFNEGLNPPRATHVYNSIDHERFNPDRVATAPVREEFGIPPNAALLGQVSQITPWKGQDAAIRTVAELRGGRVDAHLLIVGRVTFAGREVRHDNEGYLRALHRLVEELGVRDVVHFLGGRSDVPGILRALDLSLLPSRNEPFGRVTVESMAMGTPPLVSEVGSGPELVQDGVSGRLLPPGRPELWAAAARALLADRPALARMGARAREAARRFSDDSQIQGVLAVYERLLGLPEGEPRASSVPVEQGARESAEAVSWPG